MVATPAWPILVQNDAGQNIRALQCLLNYRNNNTTLTVDGSFGPLVYNAVTQFQRQCGVISDGQAGMGTLVKLITTVERGTINNAVRAAQYLLCKFESLAIDGNFGPGTEDAVISFQNTMDITNTGCVDKITWQYLFGYNNYTLRGQDYRGQDLLTSDQKIVLNKNKPFYQLAANTYGIPWQMFASIHYREARLRKSGPLNKNGPYQIVGKTYPTGSYTDEQFQTATNDAAQFIVGKAGGRDLSIPANVKRTFFSYNGTANVYITQALNLGFSYADACNGEGSSYVMNRADAKRDPTVEPTKRNNTWGQIKANYGKIEYNANLDYGAYVLYEELMK